MTKLKVSWSWHISISIYFLSPLKNVLYFAKNLFNQEIVIHFWTTLFVTLLFVTLHPSHFWCKKIFPFSTLKELLARFYCSILLCLRKLLYLTKNGILFNLFIAILACKKLAYERLKPNCFIKKKKLIDILNGGT